MKIIVQFIPLISIAALLFVACNNTADNGKETNNVKKNVSHKEITVAGKSFIITDSIASEGKIDSNSYQSFFRLQNDTIYYSIIETLPSKVVNKYETFKFNINDIDTINSEAKDTRLTGSSGKIEQFGYFVLRFKNPKNILYQAWYADGTTITEPDYAVDLEFKNPEQAKKLAHKLHIKYKSAE